MDDLTTALTLLARVTAFWVVCKLVMEWFKTIYWLYTMVRAAQDVNKLLDALKTGKDVEIK